MNHDLSDYRKSYEKNELVESNLPQNPMQLFKSWFDEVDGSDSNEEANAMTVSTIGLDGFPKSRVVLLKQFSDDGFVFYTNYNSEKGKAIAENANVCLSFFWHSAERQIIIKGKAEKVSDAISDTYFKSRPKGSQLGALASNQTEVVASRQVLQNALNIAEKQHENIAVKRPKNWGGYIVKPVEIEFWQGRPNRLHDRIRYQLKVGKWSKLERLSP